MKKSKQQLAEEYCNKIYQEAVGEEMYAPDVYQSKKDFIAGYEAAESKWISVEEGLPKNDKTVLVWVNDTENPQWSGYKLGTYLNERWYCNGGRESHEIVTDWCYVPPPKR